MLATERQVAAALHHYLALDRDEIEVIVRAMSWHEMHDVLKARQAGTLHEVAGALVAVLVRAEMRLIDESDEGAVCEVIDRAGQRLTLAQQIIRRSTCSTSSKAKSATSSCSPTINAMAPSAPSDASPPIQS
jgi:hypothetical protein